MLNFEFPNKLKNIWIIPAVSWDDLKNFRYLFSSMILLGIECSIDTEYQGACKCEFSIQRHHVDNQVFICEQAAIQDAFLNDVFYKWNDLIRWIISYIFSQKYIPSYHILII